MGDQLDTALTQMRYKVGQVTSIHRWSRTGTFVSNSYTLFRGTNNVSEALHNQEWRSEFQQNS